jgi:hypothetical protein
MTRIAAQALAVARPVIRGLTILNVLYGIGLALLLGAFFLGASPEKALGFDAGPAHPQLIPGLRAIVVIGLIGAAIVHAILRQLLAIVDTVRDGDPFHLGNARRLERIAWSVLALELLRVAVAAIASSIGWPSLVDGFSIASWFAVLLLFVLAGVFSQGARMREDLEGTV